MVRKTLDDRGISQGAENRLGHRRAAVSSNRPVGTDDRGVVGGGGDAGQSANCRPPRRRRESSCDSPCAGNLCCRAQCLALSATPHQLDDSRIQSRTWSLGWSPKSKKRWSARVANSLARLERTSVNG